MTSASIWTGRTVHVREQPFRRAFSHRIVMVEVDVDALEEASRGLRLFRTNAPGWITFRSEDHGERRKGASLRAWALARFLEAGVEIGDGRVRLISFPRVLGYGFAPISVWLGEDESGRLRGVIYEVHNTFGETHAYVCPWTGDGDRPLADKSFFVSPFFTRSGRYRFTLREPGERLELIVENIQPNGRTHVASLLARRAPMADRALAAWLIRLPFSGLGVMLAIHWQALRLLMRGAQYHHKPAQLEARTTLPVNELRETGATERIA
jgi:DUF1365 family protein